MAARISQPTEVARSVSALQPGQTISHFEVREKLGGGGMGVVYLADDLELDRKVALKFLPPHLGTDEEANLRFVQEAKAASALNHPNVCTIYEIGRTDDGQQFIAMAHYEGQTLKQKLNGGAVAANDAIDIARQIAEGLAAAHEKGITHRDIKPANIFLTDRGRAVILDFGLAKLTGALDITKTGSTLGTAYYMSPEQLRGDPVDHRTDIWSLGVALYEMLAGRRPFEGEYEQAVSYAVLNTKPDPVTRGRDDIPKEIGSWLDSALQKSPGERPASFDALRVPARTPGLRSVNRSRIRSGFRIGTAAAATMVLGIALWILMGRGAGGDSVRTEISKRQVTFSGQALLAAMSPDGGSIAYIERGEDKEETLYVQDLGTDTRLALAEDLAGARTVRWSPSGSHLMLQDEQRVTLIPRLGGEPRPLPYQWAFNCFSPNGQSIAGGYTGEPYLSIVELSSAERRLIRLQSDLKFLIDCQWLADQRILVTAHHADGNSVLVVVRSDEQVATLQLGKAAYHVRAYGGAGAFTYLTDGDQRSFDLVSASLTANNEIDRKIDTLITGFTQNQYSISSNGQRVAWTDARTRRTLWIGRIQRKDSKWEIADRERLTSTTGFIGWLSLNRQGSKFAVLRTRSAEGARAYAVPTGLASESFETSLTSLTDTRTYSTAWSPDGTRIAYVSESEEGYYPGVTPVGVWRPKTFPDSRVSETAFIAWLDNKTILYHNPGNRNFTVLDVDSGEQRLLIDNDSVGWIFSPVPSPDGNRLAVMWNRGRAGSQRGLWLIDLTNNRQSFLAPEISPLQWLSDGSSIVGARLTEGGDYGALVLVDVETGAVENYAEFPIPVEDVWDAAISQDGQTIVFVEGVTLSDIWVADNFNPNM